MRDLIKIAAALSDEGRLRALAACMTGGELCVCQITELLGLASSTVSKHLSLLRDAGLLESRKQGRWIYCRLPRNFTSSVAQGALNWLRESLATDIRFRDDAARLKAILKINPEQLCQKQRKNSACCSSARAIPAAAKWRKAASP